MIRLDAARPFHFHFHSTSTATVLYYASRALRKMQFRGDGAMISIHLRISILPSHDCGQGIRIYCVKLDSSWRRNNGIVVWYFVSMTATRISLESCRTTASTQSKCLCSYLEYLRPTSTPHFHTRHSIFPHTLEHMRRNRSWRAHHEESSLVDWGYRGTGICTTEISERTGSLVSVCTRSDEHMKRV